MNDNTPRKSEGADAPPAVDTRQLVKLAIDVAPLLLFFAVFMTLGIYWATGVLMVSTIASLIAARVLLGHVSATLLVTTGLVLGFGALTFWFDDPRFIKVKPTVVNAFFAVALSVGLLVRQPVLKHLLGEAFRLTEEGWRKLTVRWIGFFLSMAVLNEFIWRNFSDQTWATFKAFGLLPLTIAFAMLQIGLIRRYDASRAVKVEDSAHR